MSVQTTTPQKKRVVIIGGGITGLTAAYELNKLSGGLVDIVVLEGGATTGGWISTSEIEGVVTEQGPRSFKASGAGTYTLKLCCELGLQEQLLASQKSAAKRFIYLDGALHNINVMFLVRHVGVVTLLLEFLNFGARGAMPATDESVADFFSRRFGPAMQQIAQCIVSGVFAGDATKLSLRSCFPAIHEMEVSSGSLIWAGIKSFFGFHAAPPVAMTDEVASFQSRGSLYNFKQGMRTLPARLLFALKDTNVTVRCNSLVVGITGGEQSGPTVKLVTGEEVSCDHVISTINPYYLSPIATRLGLSTAAGQLGSIPHADLTLVNIVGNTSSIAIPESLRGFGFLIPEGNVIGVTMDSLTFPLDASVRFRGEKAVVLTVMIGGQLMQKSTLAKLDVVAEALAGLQTYAGITVREADVATKVTRVKNGIPQYLKGHTAKMDEVSRAFASRRVTLAGMAVLGPGVNDSLLSGFRAAQCVEQTGILSA